MEGVGVLLTDYRKIQKYVLHTQCMYSRPNVQCTCTIRQRNFIEPDINYRHRIWSFDSKRVDNQ